MYLRVYRSRQARCLARLDGGVQRSIFVANAGQQRALPGGAAGAFCRDLEYAVSLVDRYVQTQRGSVGCRRTVAATYGGSRGEVWAARERFMKHCAHVRRSSIVTICYSRQAFMRLAGEAGSQLAEALQPPQSSHLSFRPQQLNCSSET